MLDVLNSIARLDSSSLCFQRGLERETLRTGPGGQLATTDHHQFLGSKLCHPRITTDFSESQLELITPVCDTTEDALRQLNNIHVFVSDGLQDEILWPASMPCAPPPDANIPLARYGSSNLAKLKETYRSGLGYRYGRTMQTICAIHYNFSFRDSFWKALHELEQTSDTMCDFRSRRYFDLMRNFRRLSWLPTYLFGASPAVSDTFVSEQRKDNLLRKLDDATWYGPNATSLRNGGLGYQSATQSGLLNICYNSLDNYLLTLAEAICTKYENYDQPNKDTIQVNPNILQSEAEFYTSIRAKRVPPPGANLLEVLQKDGVEYIEVRLLDVNPYAPVGIDAETINFLDMLLVHNLFSPSPIHDDVLCASVEANMKTVVYEGRSNTADLDDMGSRRSLREWGNSIMDDLMGIADVLDRLGGSDDFHMSLETQRQKLEHPELTTSARMIDDMQGRSFHDLGLALAQKHRDFFHANPLSKADYEYLSAMAHESLKAQQKIDAKSEPPFAQYLDQIQSDYEAVYQAMLNSQ
ncbi:MAG TPA: glutamate--cysteine ligase [Gammaproteobacteria bacterium]|nr:glutamate--cysteine ligase [Gammaproteobacteria bacterium]|tara:strand:- start:1861 stop:3435 length:1575 start_codon:yes stop_codon:yes gene_type:complete